jgi:BirA family biotin operon repressor/biotin-[acetyl-CoA-carboxylase] ligase
VAACEAIDSFLGARDAARPRAALKWPNDLLLPAPDADTGDTDADADADADAGGMRKVGGLLLEASFARAPEAVVLGLGLNVNQTAFPGALAATATSLAAVRGRPVPRPPLLARLLARLERRYDALLAGEDAPLRAAYTARLHHRARRVTLRPTPRAAAADDGAAVTGIVEGVTPTGALRLRTDDGAVRTFHAGDVTTHGTD